MDIVFAALETGRLPEEISDNVLSVNRRCNTSSGLAPSANSFSNGVSCELVMAASIESTSNLTVAIKY